MRIARGRWFAGEDDATLAPVGMLGSRLARTLFGDADPPGARTKLDHQWLEVVGVLGDRAAEKAEFEGLKMSLDDERLSVPEWVSAGVRVSAPQSD